MQVARLGLSFKYNIFNRRLATSAWKVRAYKHRFCKCSPTMFSFNKQRKLKEKYECSSHNMHASLHDSPNIEYALYL